MIVNKIKLTTLDGDELIAEKGKIFFEGEIKTITISRKDNTIKITFKEDSEWTAVEYPIKNLQSFTYGDITKTKITPRVHSI